MADKARPEPKFYERAKQKAVDRKKQTTSSVKTQREMKLGLKKR